MKTKQHGFTLIELMITVVIIAILASIALPSYQNYVKKSKLQEGQSNLVSLSLAIEAAYQRQLAYPTTIPSTWSNSGSNFSYTYTAPSGTTPYSITAIGTTGSVVSGCTLTLTQTGTKTLTGCGSFNSWVN